MLSFYSEDEAADRFSETVIYFRTHGVTYQLYLSCEADDLSVVKHVYLLLFVSAGSACRQSQ